MTRQENRRFFERLARLDRLLAVVQRIARTPGLHPIEADPIFVRAIEDPSGRFTATAIHAHEPIHLTHVGSSAAEALANLETMIKAIILNGGDERGVQP